MGRKVSAVKKQPKKLKFEPKKTTAPPVLRGLALETWERIQPELERAGISSVVEENALACYCQAVADFDQAQREIDRLGLVVQTERGFSKNPACTIKAQAAEVIYKFGKEFGLTPASRKRVAMKEEKEQNEFDPSNI